MRVLISWSGRRSEAIANALTSWLSDVFQDVTPWMSAHDIDAGSRWGHDLSAELESASYGILCMTPENVNAPWLLFEAGALSKAVNSSRVVPYRFRLDAAELPYPLAQFQGVNADKAGTFKLVDSINVVRKDRLASDRLQRLFDKWWPELDQELSRIPDTEDESSVQRSDRELLEEILVLVRSLQTGKDAAEIDNTAIAGLSSSALQKRLKTLEAALEREKWHAHEQVIGAQIDRVKKELKLRGTS